MKRLVLITLLLISIRPVFGYFSAIAIQTERHSAMQVFINGKLINKEPEKFVRIKSRQGLVHLQVKVLNPHDKEWYMIRKDIRVEKGYEFYYRIVFPRSRRPELVAIKRYPVYSKFFLNPGLYNTHPIS
jgi:hypothetical protein